MAVTSAQWDRLIDLYLLGKLAKAAWLELPTDQKHNGSTFKELEEVKELAHELHEGGAPEERIANVLRETLPMPLFHSLYQPA